MAPNRFITLGGTETYLLYIQQFNLRNFCAFEVIEDFEALRRLENDYLRPIVDSAIFRGYGVLIDALVWRASPDHITQLLQNKPGKLNKDFKKSTKSVPEL